MANIGPLAYSTPPPTPSHTANTTANITASECIFPPFSVNRPRSRRERQGAHELEREYREGDRQADQDRDRERSGPGALRAGHDLAPTHFRQRFAARRR